MINRVNTAVKFSYDIARGSSKDRLNALSCVTDEMYSHILPRVQNDTLKVSDFKDIIKKVLPEKKPIRYTSLNPKSDHLGESDYIYGKHDEVIGQTIGIPFKRGKIKSQDIPVCIHEFVHVLDTLYNPKFVARTNKMHMNEQYDNRYDRCFDVLYHHEKFNTPQEKINILDKVRKSVYVALSGRSREDKINLVQELRNEMQSEYNAYRLEDYYAKKLYDSGIKINKEYLTDYNDGYMFKEKFDLLTQVGKELVADARKHNTALTRRK